MDLFFPEGGDHVEIHIYNLKQAPVCHWATVDQKLFFGLNLCKIARATIICTKLSYLKKKNQKQKDLKQCLCNIHREFYFFSLNSEGSCYFSSCRIIDVNV